MSSSSTLELAAPAKLNLFLEVCGRREDGYHEIDSVVAEIDLHDRIRLHEADSISLSVTGLYAPEDETNLAWQAAAALGVGARIAIDKRIPAGAGLGGGSSDAAAVLLALDAMYGLGLPDERLAEIARGLGADVPFFLQGGTARCTGIGDELEPVVDAPEKRFVVVVPPFQSSTKAVYGALGPGLTESPQTASFFLKQYLEGADSVGAPYFNRLQRVAERLDKRLPAVRQKAEEHFGVAFTLTGSGSSYFAEAREELRGVDRLEWGEHGPVRAVMAKTG